MTKSELDSGPVDKLENMAGTAKEYMDLRMDALKLHLVENLSLLFSRLIATFLFLFFTGIAAFFLASAFSWWVGELLKSKTLGDIATSGLFVLIALIFYLKRRKIFINTMIKLFISVFFEVTDKSEEEEKA